MTISDLDKKILFELDKDGRVGFSDIARALKTTPQVIKYHYERLIENEVISKFWAFIDYDRVGYSFFWGYWMKFAAMSKQNEEIMLEDFRTHKFIPIVMRCDGYADLFIAIIARDVFHHNEILQSIFEKYGSYVTMSDLVVGLGFIKFPRTYLIGEENQEKMKALSGGSTEAVKISELDRKMLSLLQEDGRMDFTKMGKIVGESPGLVQKHYHKLERSGVISKVTYTLNHTKLGMVFYRVLFKIVQFDPVRVEALYDFCEKHQNIVNYVKVMGNWQLMLDIEIENRGKLRDLLREMKISFHDIVFEIEINEIYKIEKFTQMAIEYPELGKNQTPENK